MGCFNSKPRCIICYQTVDRILVPCSHYILCFSCCKELSSHYQGVNYIHIKLDKTKDHVLQCPLCRSTAIPKIVYQ